MKLSTIALILVVVAPVVSGRLGDHRKLKLLGRKDKVVDNSYILVFENDIQDAHPAMGALINKAGRKKDAKITVLNNAIKAALIENFPWQALQIMLDDPSVKYAAQVRTIERQKRASSGINRVFLMKDLLVLLSVLGHCH